MKTLFKGTVKIEKENAQIFCYLDDVLKETFFIPDKKIFKNTVEFQLKFNIYAESKRCKSCKSVQESSLETSSIPILTIKL